jgi:hypothetical protein
LVALTPLKEYEFVNEKDYPIYYGKMFQTTNQYIIGMNLRLCQLSLGVIFTPGICEPHVVLHQDAAPWFAMLGAYLDYCVETWH